MTIKIRLKRVDLVNCDAALAASSSSSPGRDVTTAPVSKRACPTTVSSSGAPVTILSPLLDEHGAPVGRPGGPREGSSGRLAQRRHRRPAVELHGPDTAVGLTQHLGLSPRWLDHVPLWRRQASSAFRTAGGAAVQCGDAELVLRRRRHQPGRSVPPDAVDLSRFCAGRRLSLAARRPQRELRPDHPQLHDAQVRRDARGDFGKICVAQRSNAWPSHTP